MCFLRTFPITTNLCFSGNQPVPSSCCSSDVAIALVLQALPVSFPLEDSPGLWSSSSSPATQLDDSCVYASQQQGVPRLTYSPTLGTSTQKNEIQRQSRQEGRPTKQSILTMPSTLFQVGDFCSVTGKPRVRIFVCFLLFWFWLWIFLPLSFFNNSLAL